MSKHCVNHKNKDVVDIANSLGVHPAIAASKIAVWQENNGIENFPSINDLRETSQSQLKKEIGITNGREISNQQLINIKSKIARKNKENIRLGIPFNYQIESKNIYGDTYNYTLKKYKGNTNLAKKFERENNNIVDPSQNTTKVSSMKKNSDPQLLLFESKKNFNNLLGKTEAFGIYKDSIEDEDSSENTSVKNSIISTLFNGEIKDISAKEVLLNIIDSGIYSNNPLMSNIVNKLLNTEANVKIVDDFGNDDTYMTYDAKDNSINVSENTLSFVSSVEEGVSKFLHEVFHDRTIGILRNPQTANELKLVGDIKRDYVKVKNFLQESYSHEVSSVEEFTAAMFSNKDFENEVKELLDSNSFWNNIKNFFKKLFNLSNNYDTLMSNIIELIDNKNTTNNFNDVLDSKYTIGQKKNEKKHALDDLSHKIDEVLKVLQIQSSRLGENSAFKKKLRETTKQIEAAEKEFDKDINAYRREALGIFLKFMTGQLHSVEARILNDKKFNSGIFNSSKTYVDAFISIQEDIDKALDELLTSNNITDEDYDAMTGLARNLKGVALRAKQNLIEAGKKHIKKNNTQFSKGYKEVELRYKHQYQKEGREKGLFDGALEEYVNKQMSENRDLIKEATGEDFNNMLDHPIVDIDSLSIMFNSEKDFTHPIISIFSSILDKVKDLYDNAIQRKLINLQEQTNKFLEGKRTKSSDDIYKNMVEVSKSGTTFLKGEYSIEYHDIVNDLKTKRDEAAEEHGKESKEYKDAAKEYKDFIDDNTILLDEFRRLPMDKWKTDLSDLSKEERIYLKQIQTLANESNNSYGIKTKSLKKMVGFAAYYELPKIRKAQITSLKSGNLLDTAKEFYNETFTRQTDQEDLGQEEQVDNIYKVYTDLSGKEVRYVPIHYRIPIDAKHQSIDLPTIYALEYQNAIKFKQKNMVANDLLMFKDVIQEGKFIKKKGFGSRMISSVYNKNNNAIEYTKEDAHLIKMLDTILNNRLYDKTNEYAGKIFGQDVNKVESFLRGTISKASMALNTIGAPANLLTGKAQNLFEVIRDPNLTIDNVKNAEKYYYSHLGGFMDDMGRNVYKSIGNQLLLSYGGLTSAQMLQNNFEKNKTLALANDKALYFFQEAGEHHIAAIHTMTILDSAKILDKDGNYLNKEGNVVKTKSEAASLLDISVLENGTLNTTIKKPFFTTLDRLHEFNRGGRTTVRSYIQSSLIKAQGNYGSEYTSELQRHFYGKALFHFKKHIISPALSRWRGVSTNLGKDEDVNIKYNYDLQRPDEGNYVTTIRFIKNVVLPKIKKLQLSLIVKEFKDRDAWEQANIRRTFTELATVSTFASLAYLFAASAGDDDDEMWFAAAVFRRLQSEASQYYDITEAWRVLKNPISSLAFLESTSKLLGSVTNLVDPFTDDRLEHLEKNTVKMTKFIPGNKIFKEPKEAFEYLNRN